MAITPKFKPGQLVKFDHPSNPTLGLIKSVRGARNRIPALALVQWCGKYRQQEEYIWQKDLTVVEDV